MKPRRAAAFAMLWTIAAIGGCAQRNAPASNAVAVTAASSKAAVQGECAQWAAKNLSGRMDLQIPPQGCECLTVRASRPFAASGMKPQESVNSIVALPQGNVEVVCRNDSPGLWLLPREFHGSCGGCAVVRRK